MNPFSKMVFVCAIAGAVGASACTAEPETSEEGNAPLATLDSMDETDEGTSYNGWSQDPYMINQLFCGNFVLGHQLIQSYGDATRGGGACLVKRTGEGCSSDSTCLASAQAQYGGSAWGYCYAGQCYSRPGPQSLCTLNPNRGPGYIWTHPSTSYLTSGFGDPNTDFVLGCMTKTAGLNPACGGTNTSLYMRTVKPLEIDTWNCINW
jgi:hypothetical protein